MGTVIMHYFSGLVSSLLKELGLSDDMFNPVSSALLLCFFVSESVILSILGLRASMFRSFIP